MSLFQQAFRSAADLAKYVNDNTIPQANIQSIKDVDGQWYLFWWA